ncbi:PREDICTED: endophilin-B1-like [Priapulus caudatus]|uniref:Endophilin-B1-like n=1 Tax=Priapulus caudatus TaxID=37621 RepID=A0ABM1FAX9_PRICU|nr:PREDICTED: endophilin-B1-like [Priapulus caudatus]
MNSFNFKKFTSDAATVISRAVQYTEEKLGGAEKTELDAHFENLAARADKTKIWSEKLMSQTVAVLQPNPNVRLEEFVYDKLGQLDAPVKKPKERETNHEILGQVMVDAGSDIGPGTAYGSALIKCGQTEQRIGHAEKEYLHKISSAFLMPLNTFLMGDMKTIQKERKILETKRLDLDACKNRLRKAKSLESQTNAEAELRVAQSEFDRQTEITKLLLEGVSSAHANHLRCLNDLVETQMSYYGRCFQLMQELQKEVASIQCSAFTLITSYLATVAGRQVIKVVDVDEGGDWVIVERGSQRGRAPMTHVEYIN